jgi:hypothetical protein
MQPRIPCPQGSLQGCFTNRHATGRFVCCFIQLPQLFAANSLRAAGRKTGSNGRDFFADGRELPNLAGNRSVYRENRRSFVALLQRNSKDDAGHRPGLEFMRDWAIRKLQFVRTCFEVERNIDSRGGTKMPCRGVHFAITLDQLASVLAASNDGDLMKVIERIEVPWDKEYLAESDKAWDAIHRCLTDGSLLYESGEHPLNHVICGGRQLHHGEDYTVSLVTPEQVKDVSTAIDPLAEHWMRERYFSLLKPESHYGEVGEEDFEYTWTWFENIRDLYRKAAAGGRAVIFTVDQ